MPFLETIDSNLKLTKRPVQVHDFIGVKDMTKYDRVGGWNTTYNLKF